MAVGSKKKAFWRPGLGSGNKSDSVAKKGEGSSSDGGELADRHPGER